MGVIFLKKVIFIIVIAMIIDTGILNPLVSPTIKARPYFDSTYSPSSGSKEELYQDIFVTLLDPYISKAIRDYYGEPYMYDIWDVEILGVERPYGDRTPFFTVRLQVIPYIGAHNSVGIDNITFRVQTGSNVKIEKFEHIKSFPIPPWLR